MDAGDLVNKQKQREFPSQLIWLVGVVAFCRSVLATVVPTLRSILNL